MVASKPDAVAPAPTTCPSSTAHVGAQLLGVVGADGRVAFLGRPLEVTEEFLEQAAEGRKAETRFRFAGACQESGCRQWTGERCGVADRVVEHLEPEGAETLRRCLIRDGCRWWKQQGRAACRVCALVVTDTHGEEGLEAG